MAENIIAHARRLEGEINELRNQVAEQEAAISGLRQRLAALERQAAQQQKP